MDRINKIALFVDYENFTSGYERTFEGKQMTFDIWESLNDCILSRYRSTFPFDETIDHTGTWLTIGVREFPKKYDKELLQHLHQLDCINRFIIKYGIRDRRGKEKGVDTELVCQMLHMAFHKNYDTCIILSDDSDFIPAVNMIQSYGLRAIQAGFNRYSRLRAACFGNLKMEEANENLRFE